MVIEIYYKIIFQKKIKFFIENDPDGIILTIIAMSVSFCID